MLEVGRVGRRVLRRFGESIGGRTGYILMDGPLSQIVLLFNRKVRLKWGCGGQVKGAAAFRMR